MDFKDINNWFLLIAVISLTYTFIKTWHSFSFTIKQYECNLCDSKKFVRVPRERLLKLFPFNSKKYYCRSCKKEYVIIRFFTKQLIISQSI